MRAFCATLLFVSLGAARLHAAEPNNVWRDTNNAGLAAMRKHDFPAAALAFEECWSATAAPSERAAAALGAGSALGKLGRSRESAVWFERAAELWRDDPSHMNDFAVASHELFAAYRQTGDYPRAESAVRQALSRLSSAAGHRILAADLADLLREEGRVSEARPLFEAELSDAASPLGRIDALIGLADLDRQTRQWLSAIDSLEQAARIARELPSIELEAMAVRGMGTTWLDAGDTARAEPLLRRGLALSQTISPPDPQATGDALASLGLLYRMENKPGLAEDALTRALDLERKSLGPQHPQLAAILEMLGDVASRTGDAEKAREYMKQALDILISRFGESSIAVAVALVNSAEVERGANSFETARADYERALVPLRRFRADSGPLLPGVLENYASLLKLMHQKREAKALLAEARSVRAAAPPATAEVVAQSFAGK